MLFLRTLRVVLLMKSKHRYTFKHTCNTLGCSHKPEPLYTFTWGWCWLLRSITPWWSLRGCFELCGFLREKTASLSVCNIQHPLLRHLLIKAHRYRNGYCNILFFCSPPPPLMTLQRFFALCTISLSNAYVHTEGFQQWVMHCNKILSGHSC